MNGLPEWWLTASGLFFVLGSIAMVVLVALLGVLVKVALDLKVSLNRLSHRVESLAEKVETIAEQVKSVTTEVGVRATGITRLVDDVAGNSLGVVERFAPLLVGIGVIWRIVRALRGRR